jgi:hypothetical protein
VFVIGKDRTRRINIARDVVAEAFEFGAERGFRKLTVERGVPMVNRHQV